MIFKNNFIRNKIAIMRKNELLIPVLVTTILMLMIFATANENVSVKNESIGASVDINAAVNEGGSNLQIEGIGEGIGTQTYTDDGSLAQSVNDCGTLNTTNAVYTLINNVTSNSTCFTIAADNITFDGAGYLINYSANGTVGYGIIGIGYNFTTIKNTVIIEGVNTTSSKYGIQTQGVSNWTIVNNTVTTFGSASIGIYVTLLSTLNTIVNNTVTTSGATGYGISLHSSTSNTIVNNTVTTSGATGYGISLLTSSTLNTIVNNTVTTSGATGYGISLQTSSSNNTISNNIITTSGVTNGYGISLQTSSSNTISNNTITTSGTAGGYGIYLLQAASNTISNNIITTTGNNTGYGIHFQLTSSNNTISNNIITTTGNNNGYGIFLSAAGPNNTISNNIITTTGNNTGYGISLTTASNLISNNTITTSGNSSWGINVAAVSNILSNNTITTSGNSSYGIFLGSSSSNTSFSGMNINTNGSRAHAFYFGSTNPNFTISDSVLNSSVQEFYVVSSATGGTWNFTNVTRSNGNLINVNWSTGGNGTLYMFWYLDTYTNYTNGSIAVNANVSSYDVAGLLVAVNLTDSSGNTRQTLLEYKRNSTSGSNYTYYSNYSINVTTPMGTGFVSSLSINMSTNRNTIFTFDGTAPNGTLSSPGNATYSNNQLQNFSVNLSDNIALSNATLYVYNSSNAIVNQTANVSINGLNNANLSIMVNLSDNGVYVWFYRTFDNSSNLFTTENRTITIDLINPNATLQSPENNTHSKTGSSINLTANISDNIGIKNVTLYVYNSTGSLINMTAITNFAENVINTAVGVVVNLAEGIYTWFYRIFDFAGNLYTTENNTLIIDLTNPNATLLSPGNGVKLNNAAQNYTVNVTDNFGIKNVTLQIYNSSNALINLTSVLILQNGTLNASVGINVSLVDGIYNWSYLIYDLAGNNFTTNNNTVTIDTVPPNASNVIYIPNDEDSVDPNTNLIFNATIVDVYAGTDKVILQYHNGTDWNNVTMTISSGDSYNGTYQANFTTIDRDSNYTYNIWRNDSAGNVNMTTNVTFESYWDCSWNYTYLGLSGSSAIGFKEDKRIGNITLSNTGDAAYATSNCSIIFTISDLGVGTEFSNSYLTNWVSSYALGDISILGLSYNTSRTVNASSNETVNIYAGFPYVAAPLSETPDITITSNINDSVKGRNSETKTITMTISQPGAYLRTPVVAESPTNVYLKEQSLSFSAYTENMGGNGSANYTAFNVSLKWILPSSFTLNNSNATLLIDSIANSSIKYYNNISVMLNSSSLPLMSNGITEICVNASGYQNTTGNFSLIVHASNITILSTCINITFLCYNVSDSIAVSACGSLDGDYVASATSSSTSGGGGGGGGGAANTQIQTRADYTIVRGKENEIFVLLKNKDANTTMTNLKFSVSGDIAKYIVVEPATLNNLLPMEEKNITIKITSPTYIPLGKQEITLQISGMLGSIGYSENRKIVLQINALPKGDVESMLSKMKEMLQDLQKLNLSYSKLSRLLNESYLALDNFEYEKIQVNYELISSQAEAAIGAEKILVELKIAIVQTKEKGISTDKTERLLKLAQLSLEREEFEQAYARAKEAQVAFALETKGEFGKLSYYLKNNKKSIGFGVGILALLTFFTYKVGKLKILKRKINKLKDEEVVLTSLIKLIQNRTFKEKKMEMDEYRESMVQYEKKISLIIEQIIDLETEVAHVLKFTSLENKLKSEKARIFEMMKQVQEDYLKKGIIESRVYEVKVESYNRRLGEIESKLAQEEAKQAMKLNKGVKMVSIK